MVAHDQLRMSFRVMPASREDSRPDPAAGWSRRSPRFAGYSSAFGIKRMVGIWSNLTFIVDHETGQWRITANRRVGNMPTLCDQQPMMPALRSKRVTHLAGTHLCTHAWTRFRQGRTHAKADHQQSVLICCYNSAPQRLRAVNRFSALIPFLGLESPF